MSDTTSQPLAAAIPSVAYPLPPEQAFSERRVAYDNVLPRSASKNES